jgi:hypothetical protein
MGAHRPGGSAVQTTPPPHLQGVQFAAPSTDDPLIEAVHFLKAAFPKGKPLGHYAETAFPTRCIPDKLKRYFYLKDARRHRSLLPDRYEFFVYRQLRQGLEAGDVFCRDSVRFRSFEDDLVDDLQWKEKERLIAETGLSLLRQPIREQLAELEEQLESRIAEVNGRIAARENAQQHPDQCLHHRSKRARKPLRVRHPVQQHDGHPARDSFDRYARCQPVDVDEIVRELAEIRIGTETALAA